MTGQFCIVHKTVQGGTHFAILQSYRLLLMKQKRLASKALQSSPIQEKFAKS